MYWYEAVVTSGREEGYVSVIMMPLVDKIADLSPSESSNVLALTVTER